MSLTAALKNPLDRVDIVPTTMNWRGLWVGTEQYFQKDVTISTINSFAYILDGRSVTKGGLDPSLNPIWTQLATATIGIKSIAGVAGIVTIEFIPKQVSVNNTGIIKINADPNNGIVNIGTDQDVKLVSTTPINLITGNSGIGLTEVGNVVTVENTGAISLSNGGGLTLPSSNGTTTISNVLSRILSGNSGIEVLDIYIGPNELTNEEIYNLGLITLDVVPDSGLTNSGTDTEPIIENTGVVTITAAPNGNITVSTGATSQDIRLASNNADLGGFGQNAFTPPSVIGIGVTKQWATTSGATQWVNYFQNGTPATDPNGTFEVDMTQWIWGQQVDGTATTGEQLTIWMGNSTNPKLYQIPNSTINIQVDSIYIMISVGKVYINVNKARQYGNFATSILFFSITNMTGTEWICQANPTPNSVYYPNGII